MTPRTSNYIIRLMSIPEDMFCIIKPNKGTNKNEEENSMKEFHRTIFSDVIIDITKLGWQHDKSIIAPTNKEVDAINDIMEG